MPKIIEIRMFESGKWKQMAVKVKDDVGQLVNPYKRYTFLDNRCATTHQR